MKISFVVKYVLAVAFISVLPLGFLMVFQHRYQVSLSTSGYMDVNVGPSFVVNTTWDGQPTDEQMRFHLESGEDEVVIKFEAKFYNDTRPSEPAGPTDMLWDYEVVEVFFLNSEEESYLELEFGPYGNYLVLFLKGRRNIIKTLLPLSFKSTISPTSATWSGEARIPSSYFPPRVNKFNAYTIHGSGPDRKYHALYSQKPPITQPDFHRLQDFGSYTLTDKIPSNESIRYSKEWRDAMEEDAI